VGNLTASGDVMLCCSLKQFYLKEFCFGNINEQSIIDIWKSAKRKDILERVESDELFVHTYCTPCRFNAYNEYLNIVKNRKENSLLEFV
jgi:MoaA/NifB/PqqE/SkfB family radical SAM enzyme